MKFVPGPTLGARLKTVTFNFLENTQTVPMLKLLMSTEAPLKHVGCLGAWWQYCVCLRTMCTCTCVCRVFTKECLHNLPILRVLIKLLVIYTNFNVIASMWLTNYNPQFIKCYAVRLWT